MKDFIKATSLDALSIAAIASFMWLAVVAFPLYLGYGHFSDRFNWAHLSWYEIYIVLISARLLIISILPDKK